MNKHQKLDSILKYMSENVGEIPQRPDTIVRKGNLNFGKSESYSMLNMLYSDGYVYLSEKSNTYGILYKGIIFLDNGGYTLQHKIFKRKMLSEKISDYVNFFIKPLGILTTIVGLVLAAIKILEFFGIIKPYII